MAIEISTEGDFLQVKIDGVVRNTIRKKLVSLQIVGSVLHIANDGTYVSEAEFSEVTVPSESTIEDLRVSVSTMIST